MTDHTSPRTAEFVETMGLLWESEGLPRIAGRIFGFLFLQPDSCSLDDMAAALGVSKASISTDARRLEQLGLIARVGRPGDRRDYWAIAPDAPTRVIALKLEGLRRFETVLADILEPGDVPDPVCERFQRFEQMHQRVVSAFTAILAELRAVTRGTPARTTTIQP